MNNSFTETFSKDQWVYHLLGIFITWLTPAIELLLLSYGLILLDYILDTIVLFKEKGLKKVTRKMYWNDVCSITIIKLISYSALALAVHAVEIHLFKSGLGLYKFIMAVPILHEFVSIAITVEKLTGAKLTKVVNKIVKDFFISLNPLPTNNDNNNSEKESKKRNRTDKIE